MEDLKNGLEGLFMKQVIGFHFVLKDQFGTLLEDTRDSSGHPLLILLGSGRILPAVEHEIRDLQVGARKAFMIPADQAYGPVDPSLKLKIPRSKFPEGTELKVGFQFQGGEDNDWPIIYRVTKIDGDDIYADGNHELAGVALHYDVEITEKRDASADEISHGHAHRRSGVCG